MAFLTVALRETDALDGIFGAPVLGDAAAALQHAQTALLADSATRHPYYWAPFVLLGDDQ